jgi:hypothetical protein
MRIITVARWQAPSYCATDQNEPEAPFLRDHWAGMKRRTPRSRKNVKPADTNPRGSRRRRANAPPPEAKTPEESPLRTKPSLNPSARGLAQPDPANRAEPSPTQTGAARVSPRPPLHIPPILLEGDQPVWQEAVSSPPPLPGSKPVPPEPAPEKAVLPESYGTGKLHLLARDPHWLYAHWDLTPEQQREYNTLSKDRHLVLRVRPGTLAGHAVTDLHVHPESRSWFIHVERAAGRYTAELGYYPAERRWVKVAAATPVDTPADTVSRDKTLRFATIPPDGAPRGSPVPARLPEMAKAAAPGAAPQAGLTEVVQRYLTQQPKSGSVEVAELVRGRAQGESAPPLPAPELSAAVPAQGVASPLGGAPGPARGFWLNLNAELVLYGGTEPDAAVTISGKPIALRPDGTFSFRFALPDGIYELAVSATSTHGESRQAHLTFVRRTSYEGEVGVAPQDPSLTPPAAESL